jgi:hypothetical protein
MHKRGHQVGPALTAMFYGSLKDLQNYYDSIGYDESGTRQAVLLRPRLLSEVVQAAPTPLEATAQSGQYSSPTRASCRPASVQEAPATCPYRLVPLHIARSDDPIELNGGGLTAVHSNKAALYRPVRDDQLTPAVGSGGSNLAPAHSGFHLLSQLAQPTGNFVKRFVPAGRLRSGGKPFSRLRCVRQLAASTDCARNTSTEEA